MKTEETPNASRADRGPLWFPFYAETYLGHKMHDVLSGEQVAVATRLIARSWTTGGRLPKDAKALARYGRVSLHEWTVNDFGAQIMETCFVLDGDAYVTNVFDFEREYPVAAVRRAKAVKAGKNSALKRLKALGTAQPKRRTPSSEPSNPTFGSRRTPPTTTTTTTTASNDRDVEGEKGCEVEGCEEERNPRSPFCPEHDWEGVPS